MMEDECRGVRQRKKQADPACCPVCGITVRSNEMEHHFSMEVDRLNKLTVHKNRKSQSKEMLASSAFGSVAGSSTSTSNATEASAIDTEKDCWHTYQRIKNNRSTRLKIKSRKRRAEDPPCPVCNERVSEDLSIHVDNCLRRSEQSNGNTSIADYDTDDGEIDVEGESFEEYEWAGQTRIRPSSLLQGGYAATGLQTTNTGQSSHRADDEDEDLIVDGDDTHVYGQSQYNERDIILIDGIKRENNYLRNLVIGENATEQAAASANDTVKSGGQYDDGEASTSVLIRNANTAETEIKSESTASSSRISIDLKNGAVSEVTTVTGNEQIQPAETSSVQIIEALKAKIREYENAIRNKSKCLICIDEFRVPVVSICCWHVHCEECWLRTLGARKLCPQCNMITSPADLRRIYM